MNDQNTQPTRYQCRHIFTDGHRCGSPCLRGEALSYYHHTTRKPIANPRERQSRRSTFHLPLPDSNDRAGIQLAIGEVLQRIAANQIDPRRAGLLLYGLQIASLNLPKPQTTPRTQPQPAEVIEEITTHPELGILAPVTDLNESNTVPKSPVTLLIESMIREAHARKSNTSEPNTPEPEQQKPNPPPTPRPTTHHPTTHHSAHPPGPRQPRRHPSPHHGPKIKMQEAG